MPTKRVRELLNDPEVMKLPVSEQRMLADELDPTIKDFTYEMFDAFTKSARNPNKRSQNETLSYQKGDVRPIEEIRPYVEKYWPDIALTAGGIALDKATGGIGSLAGRMALQFGGRAGIHYGAQGLQANIPKEISPFKYQAPQPTIPGSLGEGFLDYGADKLGKGLSYISESGGIKGAISLKLAEKLGLTSEEAVLAKEAVNAARKLGLPTTALDVMGESKLKDTMIGLLSRNTKRDIFEQYSKAMNTKLEKAFSGKFKTLRELKETPPQILAEEMRSNVLDARRIAYNMEDVAWGKLENATAASPFTVQYPKQVNIPESLILGPDGLQAIPASVKTVLEDKIVNGAIRVKDPTEFANVIKEGFDKLSDDPQAMFPQNGPLQIQIKNVRSIVEDLANMQPSLTPGGSEYITSYETTKALRNGLRKLIEVTSDDSSTAQLHGAAEALQGLLSKAEKESIGDPSLGWFPGSEKVYSQASAITKDRVSRFSGKTGGGIVAAGPKVSDPSTLGTDMIQQTNKALATLKGAEDLVAANNGDATDVATTYLQRAFNKSLKDNGTLDGKAFYDYLYDGATNQAILSSSKIFNANQRKAIRGLASYARNGKLDGGQGLTGWVDSKALYGTIALAVGGGSYAITGDPSSSLGMAGAMAVGIPFTRKFIESVILNKKGADLILKKLYSPGSKQASEKLTSQILKLLPRGTQAYLISKDGGFHNAEVDANGKIVTLQ